jgi:hypothetical protein
MDGVKGQPDRWKANGIPIDIAAGYNQDSVQRYINQFASPYVELTLYHHGYGGRRFIIVRVASFDEMPVICTADGKGLRQGAIYTRSREMHESVEVRTQTDMREMLDLAVDRRVERRLRSIIEALGIDLSAILQPISGEQRFEAQERNL